MKRIRDRQSSFAGNEDGFTLLEALVAMGLMGLIMAIMVGNVLAMHDGYYKDMVRTQINSNLRSALDIIAMNVRQTGENLQSNFPALIVQNGSGDASDVLILRRNRISAVLAVCQDISAGVSSIPVSRADLSVSQCVTANVTTNYNAFAALRSDDGGTSRMYLYDTATDLGEFVDYTAEQLSGGQYFLTTSATDNEYSALTSAAYLLEEFRFEVNEDDNILVLEVDGDSSEELTVAFDVVNMALDIEMDDAVTVNSFLAGDATYDWKNIRNVNISLTGQQTRKGKVFDTTVSAGYFPRNVLSYDG